MLIPINFRPEFDLGRVYAIRDLLAAGNYDVDPCQVADKLIEIEIVLQETA